MHREKVHTDADVLSASGFDELGTVDGQPLAGLASMVNRPNGFSAGCDAVFDVRRAMV